MKKTAAAIFSILLTFCLFSCQQNDNTGERFDVGDPYSETLAEDNTFSAKADVILDETTAEINGDGATLGEDGYLYITKGGKYILSGTFAGGVIVDVTKEAKVEIVLNNANIYNKDSSAIYVKSANKLKIIVKDGTVNSVLDGEKYCIDDNHTPSACIYSADDIEFSGGGELEVFAKCRNGIQSKNDLRIEGGIITVTAPKNALKGKDSVYISGGIIDVVNCKDGIKSDNETEDGRGIVTIVGGEIRINCQDDGIQAYREVSVLGGMVEISAGDNNINCDGKVTVEEDCIISE